MGCREEGRVGQDRGRCMTRWTVELSLGWEIWKEETLGKREMS